jgi:hypothetical protein
VRGWLSGLFGRLRGAGERVGPVPYDGAAELDRFLDLLLPGMTATLTGRNGQSATVDDD